MNFADELWVSFFGNILLHRVTRIDWRNQLVVRNEFCDQKSPLKSHSNHRKQEKPQSSGIGNIPCKIIVKNHNQSLKIYEGEEESQLFSVSSESRRQITTVHIQSARSEDKLHKLIAIGWMDNKDCILPFLIKALCEVNHQHRQSSVAYSVKLIWWIYQISRISTHKLSSGQNNYLWSSCFKAIIICFIPFRCRSGPWMDLRSATLYFDYLSLRPLASP